jgi:flagellar motor switch protein FliN
LLDFHRLADAMLSQATTVLGRLVEREASATESIRSDDNESIRLDGEQLVALVEIPAVAAKIVVRLPTSEMRSVVGIMFGGSEDLKEVGPMQLSIVSETVSQIAVAMAEAAAKQINVSPDGIRAELCTDAGLLPSPPFESYEATISLGRNLSPRVVVAFAAAERVPGEEEDPAPSPVSYAAMEPTPVRFTPSGQANLDFVHDVPLQVRAVLGKSTMPLREVVSLQSGSVFQLDKLASEPVDVYVNNVLIARGEVVVVDDKYAVKISQLNPQTPR